MTNLPRLFGAATLLVSFVAPAVGETTSSHRATTATSRVSTGVAAISADPANPIPPVAAPDESFTSFTLEPGVRVTLQMPELKATRTEASPHLVLYLLPNGNTTEQALGRSKEPGLDWHYGIQHIAAQTRRVRELLAPRQVITAVVEADTLSWPTWRRATPDADARISEIVEEIRRRACNISGSTCTLDLIAHSGGGSFIFGYMNSVARLPDYLEHIAFIDANYSYADEEGHGNKLLAWLRSSPQHRLVVFAYDDRHVMINGKPIVSETGGTWRATDRMARRLEKELAIQGGRLNDLQTSAGMNGRVLLARHPNPARKILHTVLVEKNGFIHSVVAGRVPLDDGDKLYAKDEIYRESILP